MRAIRPILVLLLASVAQAEIEEENRVDCYPKPRANQFQCELHGCAWDTKAKLNIPTAPRCYYPADYGYRIQSTAGDKMTLVKEKMDQEPWYGKDITPLQLMKENIGKTLHVKISTPNRYEPPVNLPKEPSVSSDSLMLKANTAGMFSFQIVRESTGRVLFDTSIGGFVFSDQFLQIATYLPSNYLYGFGENVHQTLRHDLSKFKTWPVFARDEPPESTKESFKNLYGTHPFYLCIEPDGKVHGVLLLNSNAQEYVTGAGPSVTYRTIGGIFDFYFFPGPGAEQVVNQYLSLIGRPLIPPYWGLGFQLCRWGYLSLVKVRSIVKRMQEAGIPYDVQWLDIDYMNHRMDFTYNRGNFSGLPEFVEELHDLGMKNVLIIDPAIPADYEPFARGIVDNVFIRWPNETLVPDLNDKYWSSKGHDVMLGTVWPDRNTAFPDWYNPKTGNWWTNEIRTLHHTVKFDGIWIDMNEPSNFGTNNPDPWYNHAPFLHHAPTPVLMCPLDKYDSPPYDTWAVYQYGKDARLSSKTICMNGMHGDGAYVHYDVHNLYGFGESLATQQALSTVTNKRSVLIARSTFVSSGRFTGHWLGDNAATWDDMRTSIIGVMEFNFFGIPYVGADICGLRNEAEEEMCLRWHQLGAFHPFSRNHNDLTNQDQDPARWPSVAAAAKKALEFRYHYLPFLYSLHFQANRVGATVIRPLFFEFINDTTARDIDKQFLWGSALLVTPVLTAGASTVEGFFPDDLWYSLYDLDYGQLVNRSASGWMTLKAPTSSLIPVHIRGGHILPRQKVVKNTEFSRVLSPFELLIAPGKDNRAKGFMFWDDGVSLVQYGADPNQANFYHFQFSFATNNEQATIHLFSQVNATQAVIVMQTLDIIEIVGYNYIPLWGTFALNGDKIEVDQVKSTYDPCTRNMMIHKDKFIHLDKIPPSKDNHFIFWSITWKHVPNTIQC